MVIDERFIYCMRYVEGIFFLMEEFDDKINIVYIVTIRRA